MSYATRALAVASSLLMGSGAIAAPLTLQGNYVKIGVNDAGTVGSGGATSPGIQYDSTGTATFNPAYDYLTPGNPFEGFTVRGKDGSTVLFNYYNNNNSVGGAQIGGTLVDYSGVSYRGLTYDNRAVWSGSKTEFNIEHDYRFNDNQQFVDINTRLEFLINVPTLYFGRFTDPDARAAAGDSSRTDNTRGYAGGIPATNVVLSEALVSKYALGLFTGQVGGVNSGISAGWSTNPEDYYNGTNGGPSGDHTIGLGFMFSGVSAGDIINIQYAYIFGPSAFAAGSGAVAGGAGGSTPSTFTVVDAGSASAPTPPSTPPAPTVTGTSTTDSVTTSTSSSTRTETSYITRTVNSTDADGNPVVRTYVDTVVTTIPVTTTTTTTTPVTTTTYSDSSTTSSSGTPVVTTSTSDGTGTAAVTGTVLDATAVTRTVTTSSSASSSTTGTRTVTRTVTDTDASGNPRTRTYTDTVLDTTPVTTTTTTSTPVTTIYHADGSTTVVEGTSTSSSSSSNGTTSSSVIATALDATSVTRPSVSSSSVQSSTLPVVNVTLTEHDASENKGVQKIARHHATTTTTPMVRTVVTTPVTTTTNSDGTETISNGTPVITYELWNDVGISHAYDNLFGRVDQLEVLDGINDGINGLLNHEPSQTKERLRIFENNRFVQSYNADGYSADSKIFGGGFEFDLTKGWTVGYQYNRVNINLNGVDSRTHQNKNVHGIFNTFHGNTFTLSTNAAIADSKYNYNRTVEGVFNNAGSTTGNEWWVTNRLYMHVTKWLSPFVGYTVWNNQRKAYTETGSIQSARTVEAFNQTTHVGEAGLKLETRFGGKKNDVFGVSVDGAYGTDNSYGVTASVDYKEMLIIEASHGVNDGVTNNSIAGKVKFRF
jgi:hypothetical protein